MASRRVPKVTSKEGESQCKEKHAVLLSPVGRLEISGCETGLHEIKLPKMSVLPNGYAAGLYCARYNSKIRLQLCFLKMSHDYISHSSWPEALFPSLRLWHSARLRWRDAASARALPSPGCPAVGPRAGWSWAEASAGCEVCEGAEEMTEPLKQCTAWLRAYFCEPARTEQLPVPPFHHPLLQRGVSLEQIPVPDRCTPIAEMPTDVCWCSSNGDSFTRQVLWTLLRDVKFGEAISYQKLADLAGNSRAARAVGGAMRSNPRCTSRCYREKRNLLREPRLRKLTRGSAVLTFSVIPVPEI
ncbi:methylated-DNA--protein-cysteine methyltransferase isoform X2 [Cygnus olor]|uniref:methylated-DNA--protein-cysteine methyltransferase isoform X2 n=1 Tax=Cygnus olor TaxID=8869 RepID=UPI001ADEA47A|nr:methylated-DNA--protein-cysteine methyltransferase isoform X2 [Cygnus olor]